MKTVLLIDPFVSTEYLSNKLKDNHIYTIAVYSKDYNNIDDYSKPQKHYFDKQIFIPNNDICVLSNLLKSYDPDYIINGAEESTLLTDSLSSILNKDGNSYLSSCLRFDKFLMQKALQNMELSYIKQIKFELTNSDDMKKLSSWSYPIFIKPNSGYGSINAFKINNFNDLLLKSQKLGCSDNEFLAQEFICGTEYIVDTFSVNRQHYLSNVIIYNKTFYNNNPIYRYADIVIDTGLIRKIEKFIYSVLDSLDFQNGMAHNEIIITKTGEIKLIELNNRISGARGYLIKCVQNVGLRSHDEMMIEYLNNSNLARTNFEKILSESFLGYSRCVFLFNLKAIAYENNGSILNNIKSVKEFKFLKEYKNQKNLISGLLDCSCIVLLYSQTEAELECDTNFLFSLENLIL